MRITEIFASIQGESTLQGLPCVFIRLTGCNLDCSYCDTRYAREGGTDKTIEGIVKESNDFGIPFVCITGGEPLIHKDTPRLARELINSGFKVSIETNGTIDASKLSDRIIRIIDIKCPGSGEEGKTFPGNISDRRSTDEFKFIITDFNDFDYACRFVRKHNLADTNTVLFSPSHKVIEPATLAGWIIEEIPEARLHLQLHKYIWPEKSNGEMGY